MQLAADAIVIALEDEAKILLIKRAKDPFKGQYALPGGIVEDDEEISDAVLRELKEEAGLEVKTALAIQAYGAVDRDPRGRIVSIPHLVILPSTVKVKGSDDAASAEWVLLDEIPELAFDHSDMVHDALHLISNHAHFVADQTDDDSIKEVLSSLSHSC